MLYLIDQLPLRLMWSAASCRNQWLSLQMMLQNPACPCRDVSLLQVHGMHSVDAVAEKLVAEIGSRSKTSGFAAATADQQQAAPAQDGSAAAANGPAATAQA